MNIDKKEWNNIVTGSVAGSFLQSWEWGEMQAEAHVPYWRLRAGQGDESILVLAVKRVMPGGRGWLYVPGGPITNFPAVAGELWPARQLPSRRWRAMAGKAISNFQPNPNDQLRNNVQSSNTWREMQEKLMELAQREKAVFVRVEPRWGEEQAGFLTNNGWRKADHDVQPRHTLAVDLRLSEEELLAGMNQKTRYNINLARRKGVKVIFTTGEDGVEAFLKLAREVEKRSEFHYHPPEYYRVMHKALTREGMLTVALAKYEGKVLAAHLLITFGGATTYVHGASSSGQREVMAPHLLQWESIRRAKAAGKQQYDFFGVAPQGADEHHDWAGITRFKLGFGGRRVDYVGAYDLALEPYWYWIYNVGRKFLR
ncbi:MAG: peptidoglycan bridge formation glycyltransferase FemA/FemB family protein [Candidatus Andersenbacteria bacterium]|nr:peptidoglycan bridge formation glycyltransferase FemA/FemB family protein [Candidatus Andersenbacteria bacterium]